MDEVQLAPGKYVLRRTRDGAGDAGPVFVSIELADDEATRHDNGLLKVGCLIECGSLTARTYSYQDYWMTTIVTEIIEVNHEKTFARFKTGNSEYTVEVA